MQCLSASKIPQAMWVFQEVIKTFLATLGECHHKNSAFKFKCSFAYLRGVWQPQDRHKQFLPTPTHNTHVMLQVWRNPTPETRKIFPAWKHWEHQIASSRLKTTSQDSPDFTNVGNSVHRMSWAPRVAPSGTTPWAQFPGRQWALGAWEETCLSSEKMARRLPPVQGWWDVPHNLHFKDPEPERRRQSHVSS